MGGLINVMEPHTQYALESSLGNAATKDVGTTAGTVAEGNDSRFPAALSASTLLGRGPTAATSALTVGAGLEITDGEIKAAQLNTVTVYNDGTASISNNNYTIRVTADPNNTTVSAAYLGGTGRTYFTSSLLNFSAVAQFESVPFFYGRDDMGHGYDSGFSHLVGRVGNDVVHCVGIGDYIWYSAPGFYGIANGATEKMRLTNTGTLSLSALNKKPYTVGTLPVAPSAYDQCLVVDALAPAIGSAVVGGGSVAVNVIWISPNWLVV